MIGALVSGRVPAFGRVGLPSLCCFAAYARSASRGLAGMLAAGALSCGADRRESPLPALDPRADLLPSPHVALRLAPDRATFDDGVRESASHALDPAHPELAEALWPTVLAPWAGDRPLVVIVERQVPAEIARSAAEAARGSFPSVWLVAVDP